MRERETGQVKSAVIDVAQLTELAILFCISAKFDDSDRSSN